MAEAMSAELVIGIARDVYLVAKWTYGTVRVAQQHDEHLTQLQKRLEAQVAIIAGFARMFLINLPPNDPDTRYWLPEVKLKFEELQKLFAGRWARLALKYDHNYRDFNEIYTKGLESGEGRFVLPMDHNQWLIEDVSPSASAVQTSSNHISRPLARITNIRISNFQETGQLSINKLRNSVRDTVARYKFAAWDSKKIETTLTQMEKITADLQRMSGLVMLHHPRYSPRKVTRRALRECLNDILRSPGMRRAADTIGVTNHAEIQRVIELGDDDGSAEEHQNRLDDIPIPVSHLPCSSLEPEECKKLCVGTMKDIKGTKHDVLIEYKGWASNDDEAFVAERRRDIQSLVHVLALAQPPFYPNLLSLRGYVDQEADHRYAFVFDFPLDSLHEQPLSLQDIIKGGSSVKGGANLENRFKVALELAKSVAALHTVGWVHESICSDSVVIFKDAELKLVYDKPYLVNFGFSRPAGSATKYASAAIEDLRLYQHPERLRPSPPRYTKKHDLFSLGAVLLEIGLWKTTKAMCESKGSQSAGDDTKETLLEARDVFLALAKEDLGERMGESYQEAVISLLSETTASYDSNSGASIEMIKKVINSCRKFDSS